MKRLSSKMSAAELNEWLRRHILTVETGAARLGITRTTLEQYLHSEDPLPETVAMLADAIDELTRLDILDRIKPRG